MNIFITGSNGFIGKHLKEALKEHNLTLYTRKQYGDLSKAKLNLEQYDIIIHIAGLLVGNKQEYINSNIKATKHLFENIKEPKQVIHFSTAGVLGPIINNIPSESSNYNPTNLYEQSKTIAEKIALSYKDKFPLTIIRPEFIYGPEDLHVLQLFKAIKEKKFAYIGSGNNTMYPCYIDDLIEAVKLTINNKEAFGKIFNVGGPRLIKMKEFISTAAKILKVPKPKLHVPKIAAVLAEPFVPMITKTRIQFFTENRGCTINKIMELGYKPKVDIQEGITRTVNWYKEHNLL
ncbi:MAG: NAD(P)-dependent oxidoreductase [Nanoarchaeota archaeon]